MKVTILKLDIPTAETGHIYPRVVVEEAIAESNERLGQLGMPVGDLSLADVSHGVYNLRVEGDELVGDVKVFATPQGELLQDLLTSVDFRVSGVGELAPDNVIANYHLTSINAVPK